MTTIDSSFKEASESFSFLNRQIDHASQQALARFKQVTRGYALFHVTFFILGIIELFSFTFFFSLLIQSTLLAFSLAALLFTAFAYFVLLVYFQAKKPQQLVEVRESFLDTCRSFLPLGNPSVYSYLHLCFAIENLLNTLHRQEYDYYSFFPSSRTVSFLSRKFSAWAHWKDLHQMKEILLLTSIEAQLEIIKLQPTDPQTHLNLANLYTLTAKLYQDPRHSDPQREHPWVSPEYQSPQMQEQLKEMLSRAIEELNIVDAYSPGDVQVHIQLAQLYQSLGLIEKEMAEYEIILQLTPDDIETLFRLGIASFALKKNGKALILYEKLKLLSPMKGEELIAHYGKPFYTE